MIKGILVLEGGQGTAFCDMALSKITTMPVIPATSAIHSSRTHWIPAGARVTDTVIFICLSEPEALGHSGQHRSLAKSAQILHTGRLTGPAWVVIHSLTLRQIGVQIFRPGYPISTPYPICV
jgi:hypothetical protein